MSTPRSDPRGPLRPAPPKRPSPAPRASFSTEGYPRLRAAVWAAAILCGGLVFVLLFFSTVGVVDFYAAPALGMVALAMAAFFIGVMWSFSRSARRGNSRWSDRERRGF